MVWLKIRKHDIKSIEIDINPLVVVWLKIRKHDIPTELLINGR